jgi:hypothetical protein
MIMLTAEDQQELKEVYVVDESDLIDGPFFVHNSIYAFSAYEHPFVSTGYGEQLLMQYADIA